MTNLPQGAAGRAVGDDLPPALDRGRPSRSSDSGDTVKFLWELDGGSRIETVLMLYPDRATVCVSSQAGCAMGCGFCATGQAGFTRHLTVGEIVEQVVRAARRARGGRTPRRATSCSWAWASRSPTRPPCGVRSSASTATSACRRATSRSRRSASCPASARSPHDRCRSTSPCQPARRQRRAPRRARADQPRYPLDDPARRVHRLPRGQEPPDQLRVGDDRRRQRPRPSDAAELAALCRRLRPQRPRQPDPAQPDAGLPDDGHAGVSVSHEFRDHLEALGANATVRQNRGTDIDAACGQLAAGQPVQLTTPRFVSPRSAPIAGSGDTNS